MDNGYEIAQVHKYKINSIHNKEHDFKHVGRGERKQIRKI